MQTGILHGIFFMAALCVTLTSYAQGARDTTEVVTSPVEKLKYKQQPGLALAASKIFFSDRRWSLSGFGEFNYVPLQQQVSRDLGDLELYYSGLYRFASFFGYRFSDKFIWNSEFQVELLHDRAEEYHAEIVIEAFVDYLWQDYLKARFGFYPLTIGYVNNNDEPVMFYSVNRAEVERLIVPSTWIELGAMLYGNISENWSYALGFSQGLNSRNYLSGTWIRQGREIRFDLPRTISVNPQITYTGWRDLTLSASGYFGPSGQGATVINTLGEEESVDAVINLWTAYAKYDWRNFRFVTVGAYGTLSDTERIYTLTIGEDAPGQVLGRETFGYLFELGCDILPWLRSGRTISESGRWHYNPQDMKLSLFGRFERLDTHFALHPSLLMADRVQNDLSIWTYGINFNTSKDLVIKANAQYRIDHTPEANRRGSHLFEMGVGFIF
jgi:hypothetical protein